MSKSRLIELLLWLVVNQILFMEIYNYVLSPLLRREVDTSLLPNIFSANKMSPLQSYDKSYYCSLYPSECSQVQCGIRAYNETAVYVTTQNNSLVMSDMGSYRFPISLFPSLSVLDNPLPIANSLSSLSFQLFPKATSDCLLYSQHAITCHIQFCRWQRYREMIRVPMICLSLMTTLLTERNFTFENMYCAIVTHLS